MSCFSRWMVALYMIGILFAASAGFSAPTFFSDEVGTSLYDCTVVLQPSAKLTGHDAAQVLLEAGNGKSAIRVTLTKSLLTVESVNGSKITRHGEAPTEVTPGTAYPLSLLRRGNWLAVLHGETTLFRGQVPRAPGHQAGMESARGWTLQDARVQRLEPVAFADNFMRTADEKGQWTTVRGEWALQSAWDRDPKGGGMRFIDAVYAQNPFAWVGRAATGSALCLTGQPFWEDYTLTAAVQPAEDGAVGLAVNMANAKNGYLVRWSPGNDRGPQGDQLALYKLVNGQQTLLVKDAGGYLPGMWYQLTITSDLGGLRVTVDGRERIAVKDVSPWRGAVGLYAEGAGGAIFDDVTVYGHTLKTDLLAEHRQANINQRYQIDHKGIEVWAAPDRDWLPAPATPGARMHRWDFWGDHWITIQTTPTAGIDGDLTLVLRSDGSQFTSGYRAVLRQTANPARFTATLYRDAAVLATKTLPVLNAGEEFTFRLSYLGNRIVLEEDGDPLLDATAATPLRGLRPAYAATGAFGGAKDPVVVGHQVLDYAFSDAPTDWYGQGAWMPTTRWSCTPHWSFLGGWNRGDAALWLKQRFTGDQSFEAYVAIKMEYPRERQVYEERYRNLGLTICGDGFNPRTGYTAILGAPDKLGTPNRMTVLLRNGVEVASAAAIVPGMSAGGHTAWYGLTLHKRGAVIEFRFNGAGVIRYTDPNPLDGGQPAVWSADNGIALGRARIHFAKSPQPVTPPRVIIDQPWTPEWAGVGVPLTVDFPRTWSTTGKPTTLTMAARNVPVGEKAVATVDGTRVKFTPTAAGTHWYQVTAGDGEHASWPFDIALPVFTPALGRDDSRTLVLYRFDEGSGNAVHDRSKTGPAADLAIPPDAHVQWLPGQGLALHGINRLLTSGGVPKLMAIDKSRVATFEFWVSTDTIFPQTDWLGYLLSWEKHNAPQQNLAIAQCSQWLVVMPNGTQLKPRGNISYPTMPDAMAPKGMRTGLQHLVVTWDGGVTRCYANGVLLQAKRLQWKTEGWAADAQLMLGSPLNEQPRSPVEMARFLGVDPSIMKNQQNLPHGYLGTYYLVAVHDRCLSDADVQRHYQAGPGAR
ncbi:MAG: hypothetical protein ACYDBB_16785 [Armatimonadota bacterium]